MTVAAHLNSVYSVARIVLWVEDAVTRDYLTAVWGNPTEIVCLLAGGRTDARPLVDSARREGIDRVFGVMDRDFGKSNFSDWHDPKVCLFHLPRHEVENYLLDIPALTRCALNNRGRTDVEIQAEMHRLAALQPCWMACRRVMSTLRIAVTDGFPKQPAVANISSVALADAHIRTSPWFGNLSAAVAHWTAASALSNAIQAAHTDMQNALVNGTWLVEFSGSEIFRPLRDFLYTAPPHTSPDSDLAKAVGAWQEANNKVPTDLRDLRSVLRQRVGLPP